MTELIVAVFDTETEAARAETDLELVGIPRTAIRRYQPGEVPTTTTLTGTPGGTMPGGTTTAGTTGLDTTGAGTGLGTTGAGTGVGTGVGSTTSGYQSSEYAESHSGATQPTMFELFWAWLTGEEATSHIGNHEHAALYEGHLSAGQVIVSVRVENDHESTEVMRVLERHEPADVATRYEDTKTGSLASGSMAPGMASGERSSVAAGMTPTTADTERTADETATLGSAHETTHPAGRETVIPLAAERVDIGKRTETGSVRVRRYTVETPVAKEVSLRDETTTVERRRPIGGETAARPGQFEERVVETTETREVPVVEKTAHVGEEVVVNKTATDRVETVHDTERHQEVEVEGAQPRTGTTTGGLTEAHTPEAHTTGSGVVENDVTGHGVTGHGVTGHGVTGRGVTGTTPASGTSATDPTQPVPPITPPQKP